MTEALRPWLMAGLLAVLCGVAAPVRAEPAADDPIARGVELRRQGKNAEALAEFERAYAQSPSPRAIAQIALARQALGHWVEAEQGLLRALAAEDDAWIARNATALRSALVTVRDHLATLRIETDVEGATIWISGAPVGIAPLASALRVAAGEVRVEARAEGRAPVSVTLNLAPRAEEQMRLALPVPVPEPVPAAHPKLTVPRAATAQSERAPLPLPASPPQPRDSSSGARTGAVIAFVAGGVLLGGAITAHAVRAYHADKWNDETYCSADQDCSAHYDRAQTAQTLAIVGYAAAGAALTTGVVLLLIAPGESANARAVLGVDVDPHGARMVLRGNL